MNKGENPGEAPGIILVIDDNSEIVHLTCALLGAAKLNCLGAVGSSKALSIWEEHRNRISLVLTDLEMPGLNGDQLVERFLKEKPDLKFLFTSGTPWVTGVDLVEGVNYFPKPCHISEIAKRIKEMIG